MMQMGCRDLIELMLNNLIQQSIISGSDCQPMNAKVNKVYFPSCCTAPLGSTVLIVCVVVHVLILSAELQPYTCTRREALNETVNHCVTELTMSCTANEYNHPSSQKSVQPNTSNHSTMRSY